MTSDENCSLLNRDNLTQPIQMQLSQEQKHFCQFFSTFLISRLNFEYFGKNMTLIAYVFPKLWTVKGLVRRMSKKSRFRRPLVKQHDKRSQNLLKSATQHLYHIYWVLLRKFSSIKSLLVISKVLGVFLKILPAGEECSVLNSVNLRQPIQMHLSRN